MRLATKATAPVLLRISMLANTLTMPRDPRNTIPIVKSIVPKSDLGFGYAFCNWNYAMVLAILKSDFRSHDKTLSENHADTPPIDANWINAQEAVSSNRNGCMDIGCGVTLVD